MIPISDSGLERRRFPYVNVAFITINALVFLYELTLGGDRSVFYFTAREREAVADVPATRVYA